jgi:hypothetical protein
MPSSVASASGQGTVSATDISANANEVSGDIENTVSDGQAAVMRSVGRTTDDAVRGR